jgi:N-acetylmuramoyl-L-alanine amidase
MKRPGGLSTTAGLVVYALLACTLAGVAAVTTAPPAAAAITGAISGGPTVSASNVGASVPVAVASTRSGRGFWVASTDGGVTPEGDARSYGSAASLDLAAPVVSIAATASGAGYWLLGGDGGVFSYGDARFYGSTGNDQLVQPALQMVATHDGKGYWFVARDGGVFTFGDARFYGSTGAIRLTQPIVGMAPTADGRGYWLVARDGGVFTFGDARFHGSTGGIRLPGPVIGMVSTANGGGYWIVLGNGQVRAFGNAAGIATRSIPSTGFSLVGQVVTIDPGHNGENGADPGYINQLVWNGREWETCDTTGTATDAGYTEAAFNFDVGTRLEAILRSLGATVVITRTSNDGVGPCVNVRAAIGNRAGSDAVMDIHADGGPPGGRGFAVLEPVADGPNNAVIGSSERLAVDVRNAFAGGTGEPLSDYDGVNGLQPRDDLAGLNLTTVPKVLIECANMRNAGDAGLVTNAGWRQSAAASLARGISQFLIGYP